MTKGHPAIRQSTYRLTLTLSLDVAESDCPNVVDQSVWGRDGADLVDLFDGAAVGYAFAAFSANPKLATQVQEELAPGPEWNLHYAGLVSSAGEIEALPLSIGITFDVDQKTNTLIDDPKDPNGARTRDVSEVPEDSLIGSAFVNYSAVFGGGFAMNLPLDGVVR